MRGKITPGIMELVARVRGGDKQTIRMRDRIDRNLRAAQESFYGNGRDHSLKGGAKGIISGFVQAGIITQKEHDMIVFWIEFWGETFEDKIVDLDCAWKPREILHGPHQSEPSEGYRSLTKENEQLKARLAELSI